MSRVEQSTKLDLDRIIFIGRTFEEYLDMFSLSIEEVRGKKLLDCPAGACSFTAVGNKSGVDVTACDIAYDHSFEKLKNKGLQDIEHAMENIEKAKNKFKWNYFKNIDHLRNHRIRALQDCASHMSESEGRYIPAALPTLPFHSDEFDMTLSAHFLFMYGDRLEYQFHIETLNELLRVSKEEVRIFPLVDLEGKRYEHLEQIKEYLMNSGCRVEEVNVSYEFMSNANSMLLIKRN
ncbi:SAM-dependent methyltransferase [Metabacillus sp. B2-18]|uniref:SAM-dependent methyltransferase n=1 Tax=Metabacillus sp. B2-18 TaxID=2897333 RepID=UPI001E597C9C|nr:SAM-dependent methyltransferase [Metabacillus sp. B2-18]UGB33247.1 SAM-dependent methyltransferase [Metabacillus sp. B2-18]